MILSCDKFATVFLFLCRRSCSRVQHKPSSFANKRDESQSRQRSWSAMRYSVDGRSTPARVWTMRSTVDESLSVTDTQVTSIVEVLFLTRPVLNRVLSQIMHPDGSRHILVLPLTVCHVCLLRLVSSPCHPCPPDAYATLTGIDCARDLHLTW